MPERPDVERLTAYYAGSMMTPAMKWFCRKSGKSKFTQKGYFLNESHRTVKGCGQAPYSWNMEFLPYPYSSGYEARFSTCGYLVFGMLFTSPLTFISDYPPEIQEEYYRIACSTISVRMDGA